MKDWKYSGNFRYVSLYLLAIFFFQQIAWSAPDLPALLKPANQSSPEQPIPGNPQTPAGEAATQTTNQFLEDTLTLTPLRDQEEILRPQDDDRHSEDEVRRIYELERHDFEEAVDLLRPEYASAVIVKSLSEENIKSLLNLSFETAIIVLHGEIVLFSTGGKEEIGISEPVKALLEKANFISHTHVVASEENGPSLYDLENAVSAPAEEYVLSRKGVFKYNQTSFLNPGNPDSYTNYLEALNAAKANSELKDQVRARADLNQFIREMDSLNEMDSSPQIFRASEDVSPLGRVLKLDDNLALDGVDDLKAIANTPDINLGIHTERTVSIWFRVEDPSINTRKQVIYEEGGAGRGLNMYVYDGKLYA
ncbi:MAG: hypothetical protein HYZ83_07150, partial [Candidatus Omnitrophica bacterium]|nr:hypothetical protein [Candidatus Omnitrophota bacterium]